MNSSLAFTFPYLARCRRSENPDIPAGGWALQALCPTRGHQPAARGATGSRSRLGAGGMSRLAPASRSPGRGLPGQDGPWGWRARGRARWRGLPHPSSPLCGALPRLPKGRCGPGQWALSRCPWQPPPGGEVNPHSPAQRLAAAPGAGLGRQGTGAEVPSLGEQWGREEV